MLIGDKIRSTRPTLIRQTRPAAPCQDWLVMFLVLLTIIGELAVVLAVVIYSRIAGVVFIVGGAVTCACLVARLRWMQGRELGMED